jgi:hypothetical protein
MDFICGLTTSIIFLEQFTSVGPNNIICSLANDQYTIRAAHCNIHSRLYSEGVGSIEYRIFLTY